MTWLSQILSNRVLAIWGSSAGRGYQHLPSRAASLSVSSSRSTSSVAYHGDGPVCGPHSQSAEGPDSRIVGMPRRAAMCVGACRRRRPNHQRAICLASRSTATLAGGSVRANQPMRASALGLLLAGRRVAATIRASNRGDAAGCATGLPLQTIENSPRQIVGPASNSAEQRRTLEHGIDAARQHQRVADRGVALDVGLLGIDQQAAGQRLALPARQIGRIALAGDFQARLVVGKTAQPVALAQQQLAAAQAQMRIVGPVGQRHVEIAERAHPVAARRQQAGARGERRHQAMIDRQRLVVGALGFVGAAQRLQRAAPVVGDGGVAGLQQRGALERCQRLLVVAQHREAAREIDLGRGILGQELGGALQRLARLGEAAELQPRLAQEIEHLAGIGPRVGHLRQQRLGAGEVAGGRALHGVAGQRLDLEVGKGHARPLEARTVARAKKSRRSTGRLRVDRRPGSGGG